MSKYIFPPYTFDSLTYHKVDVADRWVFNKLTVAEKLGYACGPAGTNVPVTGDIIVRPIVNLAGMAAGGAFKQAIPPSGANNHIAMARYPGYFWCEYFTGPHQFVEYVDDVPMASTVGVESVAEEFGKFMHFTEVDPATAPALPDILRGYSRYGLAEFIGGKLIEYSPRHIATCARRASIEDYKTIDPEYNPGQVGSVITFGFTDLRKLPYGNGGWTWEEIEETRRPFQYNP